MTQERAIRPLFVTWMLLIAACSPSPSAPGKRDLPISLLEVSGLARASPRSVFAHDDERAIVHELDLATGRTVRRFSLGSPPATGDFEGIAADDDHIYLVTSEGDLLVARAGRDREAVPFERHDTGVGDNCEVEGLSLSPNQGNLLLLCKRLAQSLPEGRLVIYEWNVETTTEAQRPWLDLDLRQLLKRKDGSFAPSGIEWLPGRQHLMIVSARNRMLLISDASGRLLAVHRLSGAAHPQAEGITVAGSNELVIADEGGRGRPARLTIYPAGDLRHVLSSLAETSSGVATAAKNPAR